MGTAQEEQHKGNSEKGTGQAGDGGGPPTGGAAQDPAQEIEQISRPKGYAVPLLNQRDSSWRQELLGNSKVGTIGSYGCAVTCFTMLAAWADVKEMNDQLRDAGAFHNEPVGAFLRPQAWSASIAHVAPYVEMISFNRYPMAVPPGVLEDLYEHLETGGLAILEVDMSTERGLQQHFVLAVGVRRPANGAPEIIIHDPYGAPGASTGVLRNLCPRYGPTAARAIWRIIKYRILVVRSSEALATAVPRV